MKTDYWKKAAFRYDVPIMEKTTLYTRWGDWFPYIMLLITLFGCLSLLLSRRTD
ncbi:MAG: hypothetical protein U5K69_17825 [Balneolaceae bacterium]|nr:hypothetical protein [Balneolaceae bacterium]